MTPPSMSTWATLSKRFDALLSTHDLYQRLPAASVNGAQAMALLVTGQGMAKEMLALRDVLMKSNSDHRLYGAYFARLEELTNVPIGNMPTNVRAANAAELMLSLSFLRNDFDAFFDDGQAILRLRAERAFRHLQWSIASTPSIRSNWTTAFKDGETQCEALGATHLLLHGIFAYKAHAPNARTDLVFHEPVDAEKAAAVADGLVLTEWKRVTKESDLNNVLDDAEKQADLYASGVLEGTELRRVRYVVIVSEKQMSMPEDKPRDNYVVRHVNIPVAPLSPSKAAPKLSRSKPVSPIADAGA